MDENPNNLPEYQSKFLRTRHFKTVSVQQSGVTGSVIILQLIEGFTQFMP